MVSYIQPCSLCYCECHLIYFFPCCPLFPVLFLFHFINKTISQDVYFLLQKSTTYYFQNASANWLCGDGVILMYKGGK